MTRKQEQFWSNTEESARAKFTRAHVVKQFWTYVVEGFENMIDISWNLKREMVAWELGGRLHLHLDCKDDVIGNDMGLVDH